MTEADPQNSVYCPKPITVYALARKHGVAYSAHRKYPEIAALKPVANMIDGIVDDAAK